MSNFWRALRARLITPDRAETQWKTRGFHVKDDASREALELVGASFLDGFQGALEARDSADAAARLAAVDPPHQGFAYEGATMGFAILDGLLPAGGSRTAGFMSGPAAPHVYMAYVGIGWAFGKLPRFRWRAVPTPHPLERWLVLDGYGFYHAFFHTDRYVTERYEAGVRWPRDEPGDYSPHAIDQGIGRAMWFVAGADPELAATLIGRFSPRRHGDLWSGMGLAATYAGAASEVELKTLWDRAGRYRPHLAQGATFAAKARVLADLVTPHTAVATGVFCGRTPEDAAAITDAARVDLPAGGAVPPYETWRRRIQYEFKEALS